MSPVGQLTFGLTYFLSVMNFLSPNEFFDILRTQGIWVRQRTIGNHALTLWTLYYIWFMITLYDREGGLRVFGAPREQAGRSTGEPEMPASAQSMC